MNISTAIENEEYNLTLFLFSISSTSLRSILNPMELAASDFFTFAQGSGDLWQSDEPVWMALHRLEEYFENQKFSIQVNVPSSVHLELADQISIGEGVVLEPNVYIQGPCVIGPGSVIRHGAYLRGYVICGTHCIIGHGSELKRAVLLDNAQVAHLAYVGDSILGHRVNLGAGVKCANLRLDRGSVTVSMMDGSKIDTGLKKFSCVVGDGCQIGCNSVLNPGTLLGPECVAYPLSNIYGAIPARSRIKSKSSELDLASPLNELKP